MMTFVQPELDGVGAPTTVQRADRRRDRPYARARAAAEVSPSVRAVPPQPAAPELAARRRNPQRGPALAREPIRLVHRRQRVDRDPTAGAASARPKAPIRSSAAPCSLLTDAARSRRRTRTRSTRRPTPTPRYRDLGTAASTPPVSWVEISVKQVPRLERAHERASSAPGERSESGRNSGFSARHAVRRSARWARYDERL